jgi:hypothetical protein
MDLKEAEAAFRDLIAAMERDRESLTQRNPVLRRDFDNALGSAQTAVQQLKLGRGEIAKNLWTRNPALRTIARQYDTESDRINAALE